MSQTPAASDTLAEHRHERVLSRGEWVSEHSERVARSIEPATEQVSAQVAECDEPAGPLAS